MQQPIKIFGSLESQIMPIMWRDGQATVKQVHGAIVAGATSPTPRS
jgi:predicted transcriptional regulator